MATAIYDPVGLPPDWPDVAAVVLVGRERAVGGASTFAGQYYITSTPPGATHDHLPRAPRESDDLFRLVARVLAASQSTAKDSLCLLAVSREQRAQSARRRAEAARLRDAR